jgi:hypothetical protein
MAARSFEAFAIGQCRIQSSRIFIGQGRDVGAGPRYGGEESQGAGQVRWANILAKPRHRRVVGHWRREAPVTQRSDFFKTTSAASASALMKAAIAWTALCGEHCKRRNSRVRSSATSRMLFNRSVTVGFMNGPYRTCGTVVCPVHDAHFRDGRGSNAAVKTTDEKRDALRGPSKAFVDTFAALTHLIVSPRIFAARSTCESSV